jgi:nitroimidazol reductase NimA-like FMN-containing flavoprotein (pyridoxamine 5'-phosphate oxidase superfamily)
MPGYGILDADGGSGLLPWDWAVERLTNSHNYWLATTRPDGRPHAMPVWGLWLEGMFYFSTGAQSRKARNLAANQGCVLCTERADEAVILEGEARKVTDLALLEPFYQAYKSKYGWDMESLGEPVYAIRPNVVFAFTENELTGSATRWLFENV